jgi:hypothetical protein
VVTPESFEVLVLLWNAELSDWHLVYLDSFHDFKPSNISRSLSTLRFQLFILLGHLKFTVVSSEVTAPQIPCQPRTSPQPRGSCCLTTSLPHTCISDFISSQLCSYLFSSTLYELHLKDEATVIYPLPPNSAMAEPTQILTISLPPSTPIEDRTTSPGKTWQQILELIRLSPGYQRLYWGRHIEDPDKVQLHIGTLPSPNNNSPHTHTSKFAPSTKTTQPSSHPHPTTPSPPSSQL